MTMTPARRNAALLLLALALGCEDPAAPPAYCWGQGGNGQLGNGTTTTVQRTPVAVSGTRRFASISAGRRYTCAVNPFNVAFCWGDNSWRQLGANVGFSTTTPVRVAGGLLFRRVGTAHSH